MTSSTADRPAFQTSDPLPPPGDLRSRVQACLQAFVAPRRAALLGVSPELAPVVQTMDGLLAGGKGLRPAFCYWGWRAAGGADDERAVFAAASLELFHVAALVHDDVMDDSDTRRGSASVHRRFEAYHDAHGLGGTARRYGQAIAILVGDLCLTWSDQMLATCGLGTQQLVRGRRVFDAMRTEVIGGQYLDLLVQARRHASVEESRQVLRFKSAKYTVEQPLRLGGALAGAPAPLQQVFSNFGEPLGEAFQLRDDVLGVFGDPVVTGKPAGDDVREGKRTMLVALADERADEGQRAVLRKRLGDAGLDAGGLAAVRSVLAETGALAEVERRIDDLTARAYDALSAAPLPVLVAEALMGLAVATTQRSA